MQTSATHESLASWDLNSPQVIRDPYPFYAALRSAAPLARRLDGAEYLVSRYHDIVGITQKPAIFSSHHSYFVNGQHRVATLADHENADQVWGIGNSDSPDHTWKRRLAAETQKPAGLRRQAQRIRAQVDGLIASFATRHSVEFISQFTQPLTTRVVLRIFGLPLDVEPRVMRWVFDTADYRFGSEPDQAIVEGLREMDQFLRAVVLGRIESPGADDFSNYVQAHVRLRGKADVENLLAETRFLFLGGIITTAHLMANLMLLLVEHREQLATLRAKPTILKNAIEEALRFESPVQASARLVVEDAQVCGVCLPAGTRLQLLWGSANRDEAAFEDPDRFDIQRRGARRHLAFGNGSHFCVGAPLARLETQIAFEQLLSRSRDVEFVGAAADYPLRRSLHFRAPERIDLRFEWA